MITAPLINICKITYVTGFGKTVPVCTRIEIHFIAYYNSHTQGLSRYSGTIAIDYMSAFTDGFLTVPSSHTGPTQILWGHWGALIG